MCAVGVLQQWWWLITGESACSADNGLVSVFVVQPSHCVINRAADMVVVVHAAFSCARKPPTSSHKTCSSVALAGLSTCTFANLFIRLLSRTCHCPSGMGDTARQELWQHLRDRRDRLRDDAAHQAMQEQRSRLPAAASRKELLQLLQQHQVGYA